MYLVAGITGQVGGAAASRLLESGRRVRALVRNPEKAAEWGTRGVDLQRGDLSDPLAVAGALEGVEGAFLMIPPLMAPQPDHRDAKIVIASYREALRQAPPPRLVLLSSVGSEQESGLGNITSTHLMEEALGDQPFPVAIVRAGGFLDNYRGSLARAEETGWFDSFMQPVERPFPTVTTSDIGAEIARLLMAAWTGKKIVELGSPVSPEEIAGAMEEVLGRPVRARSIPREAWTATLEAMGLPKGQTGQYEEMMEGFNSGWIHFGVPGTEAVSGSVTPREFFQSVRSS